RHVLEQGHGAEERAALVEHPEAAEHAGPFLLAGAREGLRSVEYLARGRLQEPDHVAEQRALAGAAAAHADEHLAAREGEGGVVQAHEAHEAQRRAWHADVRLAVRPHRQIPSTWKMTAKMPSATMM